jgi:hypothetical protein
VICESWIGNPESLRLGDGIRGMIVNLICEGRIEEEAEDVFRDGLVARV